MKPPGNQHQSARKPSPRSGLVQLLLERTRRSRLCFNSCAIGGAPLSITLGMNTADEHNVIWVDEVHPLSGRAAIVVDNGRSCWLYLHECANGPVLRTVLCYSPIPPVTKAEFDSCVGHGDTPILISEYASPAAVIVERFPDDFSFCWRPDGQAVAVLFRDRVLAVATPEERHGSSAAVARSGPFGDPLVIERYAWL